MGPAAERLAAELAKVPVQAPRIPVVRNVDGGLTTAAEEVVPFLIKQVANPVRWTECVRRMVREGVKALGLELLVKDERYTSDTVTAVLCPQGVEVNALRTMLEDEHGVVVAGGQGKLSGKIFRIGHLGLVSEEDIRQTLEALGVPFETRVLSAHRTPDELAEYAATAEDRGLEVIVAAAGGAAALPGAAAAHTTIPVLGVPMESKLSGLDSLLSMVQMPAGVPVGTLAVGKPGAVNAAILATSIVAGAHPEYRERLRAHRDEQRARVLKEPDPSAE
jgi:5-(carboxyamino)imidazole ribonucleotide mutase